MNYLHKYSTFDSVQELNYHVKQHTNRRYYEMNETDRTTLQLISQYSVKYVGVSHLKIETIAKAIGKSVRTAIRAIRKLEALKVIEKLSTTRRISGGQGANIYVILPYLSEHDKAEMASRTDSEKPSEAKDSEPVVQKEAASLLSELIDYINTYRKPSNRAYNIFKSWITSHIGGGNDKLVNRMYGVFKAQTKQLQHVYKDGELIDIAAEAIRITFAASKRRKLRNIVGYFNGTLSNMLDDLCNYELSKVGA